MDVVTIRTPSLGDRSYVLLAGGRAAVFDPQRDIDRILAVVDDRGARVTDVFETHVHNDYVSGGLALARRTGAAYHLSADDEVSFAHRGVTDGDRVAVGPLTVRAVHTPGHTPTHLAYVVAEEGVDRAVLTGGSLLFGTVGRTDLVSRTATEALTRAQHRSARRLAAGLADDVAVLPTHGFGSFCSSSPVDEGTETSTIGRQRRANPALTITDEDAFVEQLLSGLSAHPGYYAHMAPRNLLGPRPVDLSPPAPADPEELALRIGAGEWVVDLRTRTAFAADHLIGTVNVELGDSLATDLGWVLPWGLPVTLVADTPDEIAAAQRQLVRIGIDRPAAAATGGVEGFAPDGPRGDYDVVDFADLARARDGGGDPPVLDVRRDDEWDRGRVTGAGHVPLHELEDRMDEVPDAPVWVHCASGYRAAVAASLLVRAGRSPVLIDDEIDRADGLGLAEPASGEGGAP